VGRASPYPPSLPPLEVQRSGGGSPAKGKKGIKISAKIFRKSRRKRLSLILIVMELKDIEVTTSENCIGQWCSTLEGLLEVIPQDPFKDIATCDRVAEALPLGEVLSVNLSVSCASDYITYYHGVEGLVQILEGVFPSDQVQLMELLSHSKVMMTLATNPVKGFTIPLLTLRIDVFPESGECPLMDIESYLSAVSPRICGYLCETDFKFIGDKDELRGFVFQRMRSDVGYRNTREFRELLYKSDLIRWNFLIEGGGPTVFKGSDLFNFRSCRVGESLLETDKLFETTFSNWGSI